MSKTATLIGATGSISASSTKTGIEITAPSNRVVRVSRVRVGQKTHKTSEQYEVFLQRITTTGTGTAYTPPPNEPNGGAMGSTVEITSTVEPTYTASTILLSAAWNSLTGRDIPYQAGHEKYIAPSALLGMYVTLPSGATATTPTCEMAIEELG